MKKTLRSISVEGQTFLWRVTSEYFRPEDAYRTIVRLIPEKEKTRLSVHFWTLASRTGGNPLREGLSVKKHGEDATLILYRPGFVAELVRCLLPRGVFAEDRKERVLENGNALLADMGYHLPAWSESSGRKEAAHGKGLAGAQRVPPAENTD